MNRSFQINERQIEKTLIECRRLITGSVTDLDQFSSPEKIKDNYSSFIRECHKSWKEAKNLIVEIILLTEKELEILKKNKKDPSVKKKTNLITGYKIILELFFNTFIWIAMNWDRSSVKKVFKGPKYGLLRYQNIESVLKYVNQVNISPDVFAIPLDFCRFICISDILKVTYVEECKSIQVDFIEAKSGKVNKEIHETIISGQSDSYFEFFDKYGEKGIKQMDHYFRQQMNSSKNINLIHASPGIYENPDDSEQKLYILTDNSVSQSYTDTIVKLLKAADHEQFAVDIVDECLVVGVINNKNANTAALGQFDTRLYIYHVFMNPESLEDKKPPANLPDILNKIPLNDWREGFGSVVLHPVVARQIDDRFLMDLLFGRKRILYYFNADNFIALCKRHELDVMFSSVKQAKRERSKGFAKGVPRFNGKHIRYSCKDMEMNLGEGIFHEIYYNWMRPLSIIDSMKSIE
ncbi:MAG: hypothetical protein ACE5KZ_16825 [Candidatus Scalinduaceae bacterium]